MVRCILDSSKAGLLVPAWMLEEEICSSMRASSAAHVSIGSLHELRQLFEAIAPTADVGDVSETVGHEEEATAREVGPATPARSTPSDAPSVASDVEERAARGDRSARNDDAAAHRDVRKGGG